MTSVFPSRYPLFAALALVITLGCAGLANAQSGRRSAKSAEKTPQPKISLFVGIEDHSPFANIPYYLAEGALDNCVDRLRDAAEVSVASSSRGMDRPDAVRRAKAEKEIYVVWLQIESDIPINGKRPKNGPDELYVRYTIFEPTIARVKAEGRTHLGIYRASSGGISAQNSSRNNPIYSEYALKQAAREAAEMVMQAFEIKPPEERVPR